LKILVINWQDITNPLAGGAEVHLHEVFERIAAQGHEVTLFCHAYNGAPSEEIRNGIRIIRQGNRSLFNFVVPYRYLTQFSREHYDIVIDDVNKIPFYTPLFVRAPIHVITHHLFGKSIFLETFFPFALYVYLSEKLIKPIYKDKHFIFGSPSTYSEYIEWGFPRDQLEIVNYCVNKQIFFPDPNNTFNRNDIAYFGRLKRYKSVDHLLEAFIRLKEVESELTLHIIGDGDDKPRLEGLVKEAGITDSVVFHGFIREEEKAPLLQRMNFVINTSSKEGWGLTVVEANSCGTPVIAADVQGLRDSVVNGKTGLLYEFGNIAELTAKMRMLLHDVSLRNTLRANALIWAEGFDWDVAANKTLELLTRTINRARC
jgi:glycosyltransferase involved in cell wall biosynthesis